MFSTAAPLLVIPTAVAGLLLSACVTRQYTPPIEPVLCLNKDQCAAMWSRAQAFVVQKSVYRLQLVSDSVIQTYGPGPRETFLAFTITKITHADGSGEILMRAGCANYLGCVPSVGTAAQQFAEYVGHAD